MVWGGGGLLNVCLWFKHLTWIKQSQENICIDNICLFALPRTLACAQNNSQIRPFHLRSPPSWHASIWWLCPSTKSQSGCLGPLTSWYRLMFLSSICNVSLNKLNVCAVVFTIMFRYLAQVMNLSFVREAHVKKYQKLMKLDLPAELQSLRWDSK